MNPFLHSAVAVPTIPSPTPPADVSRPRRYARHLAFMAGLGLGVCGAANAIDINSASQAQLQTIRGLGPKTAETIVRERQDSGAFTSYEDLADRVRGMGPKRVKQFRQSGLTMTSKASNSPQIIVNKPDASKGKGR